MAKSGTTHTTNYTNTFIEVAEDCPVSKAEVPTHKGDRPTIATLEYDRISKHPYKFTSDEVLFGIHCERKGLAGAEVDLERETWFSKGQACMRASPLPKRYGWGIHHDENGHMALVPLASKEYEKFMKNEKMKKYKAMRTKRA